jgi:hypothetical protein
MMLCVNCMREVKCRYGSDSWIGPWCSDQCKADFAKRQNAVPAVQVHDEPELPFPAMVRHA